MKDDERLAQIETENARLLATMAKIYEAPDTKTRLKKPPISSLNVNLRRREMQRVTEDNMRMLKNLEATPSYYNHRVWQSERKETEHILTYMGLYPYEDGKGVRKKEVKKRTSDVDDAWLRSIASLSRKSALSLPELTKPLEMSGHGDRAHSSASNRQWSLPPMVEPQNDVALDAGELSGEASMAASGPVKKPSGPLKPLKPETRRHDSSSSEDEESPRPVSKAPEPKPAVAPKTSAPPAKATPKASSKADSDSDDSPVRKPAPKAEPKTETIPARANAAGATSKPADDVPAKAASGAPPARAPVKAPARRPGDSESESEDEEPAKKSASVAGKSAPAPAPAPQKSDEEAKPSAAPAAPAADPAAVPAEKTEGEEKKDEESKPEAAVKDGSKDDQAVEEKEATTAEAVEDALAEDAQPAETADDGDQIQKKESKIVSEVKNAVAAGRAAGEADDKEGKDVTSAVVPGEKLDVSPRTAEFAATQVVDDLVRKASRGKDKEAEPEEFGAKENKEEEAEKKDVAMEESAAQGEASESVGAEAAVPEPAQESSGKRPMTLDDAKPAAEKVVAEMVQVVSGVPAEQGSAVPNADAAAPEAVAQPETAAAAPAEAAAASESAVAPSSEAAELRPVSAAEANIAAVAVMGEMVEVVSNTPPASAEKVRPERPPIVDLGDDEAEATLKAAEEPSAVEETKKPEERSGGDAAAEAATVGQSGASMLKEPLILPLQGGFTLEYTAGGLGTVKVNEKAADASTTSGGDAAEVTTNEVKPQGSVEEAKPIDDTEGVEPSGEKSVEAAPAAAEEASHAIGDAAAEDATVGQSGASMLKEPLILPLQGGFTLEYTAGGLGTVKVNEKAAVEREATPASASAPALAEESNEAKSAQSEESEKPFEGAVEDAIPAAGDGATAAAEGDAPSEADAAPTAAEGDAVPVATEDESTANVAPAEIGAAEGDAVPAATTTEGESAPAAEGGEEAKPEEGGEEEAKPAEGGEEAAAAPSEEAE